MLRSAPRKWIRLTQLAALSPSGVTPFSFDYVAGSAVADTTDVTIYTFTNVALGTDVTGTDKRYTVLTVAGRASLARAVSSVTIGGTTATNIVVSSANMAPSGIVILDTSGIGTTATVVITFNGAMGGAGLGAYRMVNPQSATPVASTSTITNVAGVVTLSINVSSGGAAVGVAQCRDSGGPFTMTWTGLTKDYQVDVDSDDDQTGAHGTTSGSPAVITAYAGHTAPTDMSGCSASWL